MVLRRSKGRSNPAVLGYLEAVRESGKSPNFWTSASFLDLKYDLEWIEEDGLQGFKELGEPGWFLPPLDGLGRLRTDCDVWACMYGDSDGEFLDYEFIYRPADFLDLSGGHWTTFRKNVRKWPSRTRGTTVYRELGRDEMPGEAVSLLASWAVGRTIYDAETLGRISIHGERRFGLFVDDRLVGLNVCDDNWEFLNFRLCLDDGSPFIQEFLRYSFYTSPFVLGCGKLVNDGGCLGLPGLERFKRKLNPVEVRTIYSYRKKDVR